jgi:hypothetical protein
MIFPKIVQNQTLGMLISSFHLKFVVSQSLEQKHSFALRSYKSLAFAVQQVYNLLDGAQILRLQWPLCSRHCVSTYGTLLPKYLTEKPTHSLLRKGTASQRLAPDLSEISAL